MKSLSAPCDKTGFFPFRFAPPGLVSSLRLSAPLVFSSPPLGEITEKGKQGGEGLFPRPARLVLGCANPRNVRSNEIGLLSPLPPAAMKRLSIFGFFIRHPEPATLNAWPCRRISRPIRFGRDSERAGKSDKSRRQKTAARDPSTLLRMTDRSRSKVSSSRYPNYRQSLSGGDPKGRGRFARRAALPGC